MSHTKNNNLVIYNENIIKQVFQRSDPTRGIKKRLNRLYTQYQNFPYEFQILHKTMSTAQFDKIKNKTSKTQEENTLNLVVFKSTASFRECFPNHYLMLEHNESLLLLVSSRQVWSHVSSLLPALTWQGNWPGWQCHMHCYGYAPSGRTPSSPNLHPNFMNRNKKQIDKENFTLLHAEYDNIDIFFVFSVS